MNELIEFLKTHKLIHTNNEYYLEPKMPVLQPSEVYLTLTIPKGLTEEQAYKDCEALFPCYRYYDNFEGMKSDRTSKRAYTIKVKANVEADENLKNLSADDLLTQGVKGITLLERLVLEKDYFLKTGKHLDITNVTMCSASRSSDGSVPSVYWYGGKLEVFWGHPGSRSPGWRSREVVI